MTDERRPPIPRPLARAVKEEAGWRCAIPTCRATEPLTLAHIVPWRQVHEHTFDNLICLCWNCHARYDAGKIERASIKNYKSNLAVVNHRYSDAEQRLLRLLTSAPNTVVEIEQSGILQLSMMNLVEDGLIDVSRAPTVGQVFLGDREFGVLLHIRLTESGRNFVSAWYEAEPVAPDEDEPPQGATPSPPITS